MSESEDLFNVRVENEQWALQRGIASEFGLLINIAKTLETIAANTTPKDDSIEKVSNERDKFKNWLAVASIGIQNYGLHLHEVMEEPDLKIRSQNIRIDIEAMIRFGEQFQKFVDEPQ